MTLQRQCLIFNMSDTHQSVHSPSVSGHKSWIIKSHQESSRVIKSHQESSSIIKHSKHRFADILNKAFCTLPPTPPPTILNIASWLSSIKHSAYSPPSPGATPEQLYPFYIENFYNLDNFLLPLFTLLHLAPPYSLLLWSSSPLALWTIILRRGKLAAPKHYEHLP